MAPDGCGERVFTGPRPPQARWSNRGGFQSTARGVGRVVCCGLRKAGKDGECGAGAGTFTPPDGQRQRRWSSGAGKAPAAVLRGWWVSSLPRVVRICASPQLCPSTGHPPALGSLQCPGQTLLPKLHLHHYYLPGFPGGAASFSPHGEIPLERAPLLCFWDHLCLKASAGNNSAFSCHLWVEREEV